MHLMIVTSLMVTLSLLRFTDQIPVHVDKVILFIMYIYINMDMEYVFQK